MFALHRPWNTFHDTFASVSHHDVCSLSPQCHTNKENVRVTYAGLRITWVTLDEGVHMDARPCAPGIKHHSVEDAAVVCWSEDTGKDVPDAVGQEWVPDIGLAQPCHSKQDQEQKQPPRERHRHSGKIVKKWSTSFFLLCCCASGSFCSDCRFAMENAIAWQAGKEYKARQ